MWLNGFWLKDYWTDGFWQTPVNRIRYGGDIRLGAGWKLSSFINSNPLEYFPYFRQLPDATTITSGEEFGFGGGAFGGGDFGAGENLQAPVFTQEVPSTPIYT